MTISTTGSRISYNGNGVTTAFSFPYFFFANGDLVVSLVNATTGVETAQVLNTDYTVTGAGVGAGGTVTMIVAPASGYRLVIYRDTAITQDTDYISGDAFPAETHERAIDKLTVIAQEREDELDRSLKAPASDPTTLDMTLPADVDRKGKFLAFDASTGEPVASGGTVGGAASVISYSPAGTGAAASTVQTKLREFVSVKDFGAVADASTTTGTDNTAAFQAAIDHCESTGQSLYVPAGRYFFNGGKLTIDENLVVYGDGRDNTVLVFGGSPTKSVVTRVVWRSEYDSGDYTSNSDAAVGWGVRINAQNVTMRDLTITTNHDPSIDYPVPFNSATDYPTSNYEFGLLVQKALVTLQSVRVVGVWNTAGFCIDGSNVGGIGDGFEAHDCVFSGSWGVKIQGASGQPVSGDDYQDLAASDTRTSAGMSDIVFSGCKIYDTSGSVRLTIDGTSNKLVRRSATTGALYINGQVEANSAKRIQGIHFNNCRFASSDRYVFFVNYANRVRFTHCHTEYRSGGYNTDGVTLLVAANCEIRNTANTRRLVFMGGEKSGETDNRTFKNTSLNIPIINEIAYDDPDPPGSVPANSMLTVDGLRDRGTWTPSLTAATPGTPAYTVQVGTYAKIGNMVFVQGRITLSAKGGITGAISIAGLPFTSSNVFGATNQDTQLVVMPNSVTTGDAGTAAIVNDNTKTASLVKIRSAATIQNITDADLIDTSRFDFSGWYMTEDA